MVPPRIGVVAVRISVPAPVLVSEPAPASGWLMLNVFAAATMSNVLPFAPYAIVFGSEFSVVPVTCNVPPLIFSASFASAAVESESVLRLGD